MNFQEKVRYVQMFCDTPVCALCGEPPIIYRDDRDNKIHIGCITPYCGGSHIYNAYKVGDKAIREWSNKQFVIMTEKLAGKLLPCNCCGEDPQIMQINDKWCLFCDCDGKIIENTDLGTAAHLWNLINEPEDA